MLYQWALFWHLDFCVSSFFRAVVLDLGSEVKELERGKDYIIIFTNF